MSVEDEELLTKQQADSLRSFIGKAQNLLQEKLDKLITEEEYEEQTEELLREEIESLNKIEHLSNQKYENFFYQLVYSTLLNHIKRNFAYLNAVSALTNQIGKYNQELGAPVLAIDEDFHLKLFAYIDDIHTARTLMQALHIHPDDGQRIINHIIDTKFPKRK